MARPGVGFSDVAEAAAHLMGEGRNPTIEQIRLILGTGSSTTIANHLREWKEQQQGTSLLAAKENIPQELIEIVKGLWERVINLSSEKMNAVEISYAHSLAEIEQELQKYKSNNQRWQQLFSQWTQEKDNLTNAKVTLEERVSALQQEHSLLTAKLSAQTEQLQDKQERIDELHRLHQQAQTNLEHDRAEFRLQTHELQATVKVTQEQLNQVRMQLQILQQAHQALQITHEETRNLTESLQAKAQELTRYTQEAEQASRHWQQQSHKLLEQVDGKNAALVDSQASLKSLTQQLADAKQTMNDLREQVKFLEHDKWLLGQERAQLEGKMIQMHEMAKVS